MDLEKIDVIGGIELIKLRIRLFCRALCKSDNELPGFISYGIN
jgi:hypothetical protein